MTEFVVADLHFGDDATCRRYRRPDGSPLRPFGNASAMDREIVRRWNDTVGDEDTVYLLGDIGRREHIETVRQLRGRKHLIAGNGDNLDAIVRTSIFESVTVAKWLPRLLLTHMPVHPSQLRANAVNVHGHLHAATVGDPRYVCVSVEQTDYYPVRLADVRAGGIQSCLF
jgi:calcineurin-like phosphoesterase family protein